MRLIRFILAIGAALSIHAAFACGRNPQSGMAIAAPVAGFTVAPGTPPSGQVVTFSDASSLNPTSWTWSFGDGGTGTLQTPTHTYSFQ